MSTQTGQYPDFTGLTFEKVWAMFKETDKQIKENDRKFQESMDRIEKERRESMDRMEKERKESLDRLEKTVAKTEAIVARTSRELGNLGNRFGEVIERMVASGAVAQFNALGFHFTHVSLNQAILDPVTGETLTEIDLLLENGEAVIAVEIKVRPNTSDINKHKQRLQIYRDSRRQSLPHDHKKIYGAIASPVFREEIRRTTLEAGFYTIEQSGKAIVINMPKGFTPKAY